MTSVEALSTTLHQSLRIDKLFIKDFSNCGCGQKFDLFIFSDDFDGVGRLDRHRKVQDILKDEIAKLHAITFKCLLVADYDAKKADITNEYTDCCVPEDIGSSNYLANVSRGTDDGTIQASNLSENSVAE